MSSFLVFNFSIANLTDKDFTDLDVVSSFNELSEGQEIRQEKFLTLVDGRFYSSGGNLIGDCKYGRM